MYRKILVPLDGSKLAECVLPHLETLAEGNQNPEIILFRVCEPPAILADFPASLKERWEEHVKEETTHIQEQCSLYLNQVAGHLREKGFRITVEAATGKPAEEILNYASLNKVDLILMATHGRSGITRWAYGSTADKVLRASPVPVMIVRPTECRNVA